MSEHEERIAARLRKLRADIGHPDRPGQPLPADQAADRAGVKYRQWQRWESGATMPHSKNLERVAERFGLDVAEFYATDEREAESQLDRIESLLDRNFTLLNEILDRLVADGVLRAVAQDAQPAPPSAPAARRRRAS